MQRRGYLMPRAHLIQELNALRDTIATRLAALGLDITT